ncbi:PepSY domain-containing protein [Nocardia testacea]|uniref:PepSY domain-containing protein n=1 Tax=Nocardia testacea TaxID=248551 RepID=A0ABW7VVD1_9NOCA
MLTATVILAAGCSGSEDPASASAASPAPATTSAKAAASTPSSTAGAKTAVDQARAEQIALATVPGGRVTSAELEHEGGRDVWEVELTDTVGAQHQVFVDPATGAILTDIDDNHDDQDGHHDN